MSGLPVRSANSRFQPASLRSFCRSSRGLTPTEAGQNFYERAKRSIEEANEAELAARGAGNGLAGRLRFSSGVTSKLQPVLVETSASSLSILAVEKVMENRRAGVAQAQPATVAPMSGRVAPALRQLRKRTRTALGRSRCTQNEGDHPLIAFPMASRMMSTTRPGAVTIGVWSIGCERTRACIRSAINRCVSRMIMRSCSAMRNQVGRSFQSGRFTGAVMHAGEIGR